MDLNTSRLMMGAAGAGEGLPEIGDFYQGGYFAGYISQTANGIATHGLIVAPKASGYNGLSTLQWKTSNTATSGTQSTYDGAANTANMTNTSHPAANYCAGLSIGGYSDWYLPARYEFGIAYYNLKPTTDSNTTADGDNAYAVPPRGSDYTAGDPAQTSVAAFQSGGAEAFEADDHWASTESNTLQARAVNFGDGDESRDTKTNSYYVRAFRKFAV
jgi:hypothetical protein